MKNDIAWEKLFEKNDILKHVEEKGIFTISAKQIKEFREPRLMTKFDHKINLPKIFKENELAILPITRGDYIIAKFDAYHKFEPEITEIINVSPLENIQSLNDSDIFSEAVALNYALASGIIADFLEDDPIIATISGRMGTGEFDFKISGTPLSINVINSQMEIDAAYEGISSMAIFEAKMDISDDFIIRQLYYPFRVWQNRITKTVRPVFFVYSNGIFRLHEYIFEDVNDYSSIKLIKQKNYSVEDTSISSDDIRNIMNALTIIAEPEIPFPQADNFERIINLCELIDKCERSKSDITEHYAFDERQADYYANAALYLGLLERRNENRNKIYELSKKGKTILRMNYKKRQLSYCECILSHEIFNIMLKQYFNSGYMPSNEDIIIAMKNCGLYKINSEETFKRRASTIKGWLNWITGIITE